MPTTRPIKDRIKKLKTQYDQLRPGKDALLKIIDEAELSEAVYNSNAIENSTLTLKETERILLEMELSRDVDLREVYEAKNLAWVIEYIRTKAQGADLDKPMVLLLHQMLIGNINDAMAGRFRIAGEYVRVGTHVAPAPEHVLRMVEALLLEYVSEHDVYFADKIAKFHLDFETIHPFNDGNGRIGRAIINWQFQHEGFPNIIIRDKEKKTYYRAFADYRDTKKSATMERVITLALMESLHKRIAYLEGKTIIELAGYAKGQNKSLSALLNAARRQTIPAFREKGVWKMAGRSS
ncbi:MAG: Fic family protein [Candidatus Jorgensenbacteria bacterium]